MKLRSPDRDLEEITESYFLEPLPETLAADLSLVNEVGIYTDDLDDHLAQSHADSDAASYDCHSFMLELLQNDFGMDVHGAPHFERPDIAAFSYRTDYDMQLIQNVRSMLQTPAGQEYNASLARFTKALYDNSDHFSLPDLRITDDESYQAASSQAKEIADALYDSFLDAPRSRVILISNGRGEQFYDAHSTIILGPVPGEKDFYVIEKEQAGSDVSVKPLSEIILNYIFNFRFKDLEINLCNKNIEELYADAA